MKFKGHLLVLCILFFNSSLIAQMKIRVGVSSIINHTDYMETNIDDLVPKKFSFSGDIGIQTYFGGSTYKNFSTGAYLLLLSRKAEGPGYFYVNSRDSAFAYIDATIRLYLVSIPLFYGINFGKFQINFGIDNHIFITGSGETILKNSENEKGIVETGDYDPELPIDFSLSFELVFNFYKNFHLQTKYTHGTTFLYAEDLDKDRYAYYKIGLMYDLF